MFVCSVFVTLKVPPWILNPMLEKGNTVLLLLLLPQAQAPPPLDSEMGWAGELWSKTNLLTWQN